MIVFSSFSRKFIIKQINCIILTSFPTPHPHRGQILENWNNYFGKSIWNSQNFTVSPKNHMQTSTLRGGLHPLIILTSTRYQAEIYTRGNPWQKMLTIDVITFSSWHRYQKLFLLKLAEIEKWRNHSASSFKGTYLRNFHIDSTSTILNKGLETNSWN